MSKPLFGTKTAIAPVTVLPAETKSSMPLVQLSPTALQLTKEYDLSKADAQNVIMFGMDRQNAMGQKLDVLLQEITKGSSPVLFQMFNTLKKGVKDINLAELEETIKGSQKQGFWSKAFGGTVGKHLEKVQERVNTMLTSKSKSLLDLIKEMEGKVVTECQKLLSDSTKLRQLAKEYRENVIVFEEYDRAADFILSQAKDELTKRKALNPTHTLEIEELRGFEQKITLFENRAMVLKTILADAPVQLNAISLSEQASLSILGETASGSASEFAMIKTALIKISVAHNQQSLQTLNDERRKLTNDLRSYGDNLLGDVAVKAAAQAGNNRLEDATKLLESAKKIDDISTKVAQEKLLNEQKFAQAKQSLLEVQQLMKKV